MKIRELDRDTAQVIFTDSDDREHRYNVRGGVYLKITAYWINHAWQEVQIGQQICERFNSYGNTLMKNSGESVAVTLRREWTKCRRDIAKENNLHTRR